MILQNTEQLLEQDVLYGYCHKTQEYEPTQEVNGIVEFKGRKGIKGVGSNGEKVYTQVNNRLFEQLVERFQLLKDFTTNG